LPYPTAIFDHVEGSVRAVRGDIVTIPFDTLRARLDGDTHWLTLTSGALIRRGRYRFASEHAVEEQRIEAAAGERGGRLLLHLGPGLRRAIDPDDIYFVEAIGDDTRVWTRAALTCGWYAADRAARTGSSGSTRPRTSCCPPAETPSRSSTESPSAFSRRRTS